MHLGLIMDGNGRWATKRSLPRAAGHLEGLKAAKRVVLSAIKLNIDYITLYVFSTENWKRPDQEVNYLMNLMAKKLPGEMKLYKDNDIRILFRGDIDALPKDARAGILKTVEETKDCKTLTVVLAVNYGGQDEIARACNRFIEKNPGKPISIKDIQDNLDLPEVPAPDMIARSAGELRLSNFMLWDSAYAEFLAIDDLWPDWGEKQLQMCLDALSRRVRKYGGLVK
ncbi:MAG: di-trans,poly-cis-decaprenylcistransferase [Spirochaetales bacterium]|jgi:undecaprenyl diphosphate synthase|nr:di-trans,poly-cis-decaprenylcistransferase [Spirochaetales bacterium]MBQ3696860.1 di-trans,poly-cis-decaprenylcistransferase [Spirochaetales bacterium]MBQ3729852.1 di-trans,poly-cis-decaprenylcistransferase [Spirochaetales bacterium]MBQ3829939.1 di-trans,poly-cis-decaprenylcistransferase [Spirochaetales bacterium]MBQ4500220.1 di-trans,poly-cis-decaprenylcistransferase [Spirochaetales bacterium]